MPILKQRLFSRLMKPEGDAAGSGGGGGGSDGSTPPAITAEVQAIIDAAVAKEVTGLKTKNGELIASQKQLKEQLQRFDGIDPEAVNTMLKRFADDEEAGLIKAGNIDEVLSKRTERMRADYQKKLDAEVANAMKAVKQAQAFQGRVLDDAIRAAAAKAGLHQHAIDDALLRGRSVFTLAEDGSAVSLGADGQPVLGKDGKSPFSPLEWLEGMKEKAPHWYPASASGGGAAGGGKGAAGKTMTRAAFDSASQAERAAFSKAGGKVID